MALLALLLLAVGTGCQMTVSTGVDVRRDGTGVVRAGVGLDDEALRQIPDLGRQLAAEDLRTAGWTVSGPVREGDGLTWVRASRGFSGLAEADQVLAQVAGTDGPFRGFRVSRDHSWMRTRTRVSGTVDLSGGLEGFSDPELRRLTEGGLDLDLESLRRRFGPGLDRAVQTEVVFRLPGTTRVWRPRLGEQLEVVASEQSWDWPALALSAAAVAAALGAVVVWVRGRRARSGPSTS